MRPAHLKTLLQQEFQSTEAGFHTPVMLWGAPGVGKSDLINQVGTDNDVCVVDIRLSQMEPSDLRGIPFKNGDTVEWAIPAMLPDEARDGKKAFFFWTKSHRHRRVSPLQLTSSYSTAAWVSTEYPMAGQYSQPAIARVTVA